MCLPEIYDLPNGGGIDLLEIYYSFPYQKTSHHPDHVVITFKNSRGHLRLNFENYEEAINFSKELTQAWREAVAKQNQPKRGKSDDAV